MSLASRLARLVRDAAVIGVLTLVLCVLVLEVLGQTPVGRLPGLDRFREMVRVVKTDVDHRNRPGSRPDLNSDGIRSHMQPISVDESSLNIIFLGDSFVFGSGLRYQHTVTEQLERLIRNLLGIDANVFNFGWVSASPLLSLRLLEDIGHKYQPDLVFLGLDMTDFRDELLYSSILEKRGIFRLRGVVPASIVGLDVFLGAAGMNGVRQGLLGIPGDRYFITAQPLEKSRPWLRPLFESLKDIDDYSSEQLGAEFVLFLFPRNYQYSDVESPESWERGEYENLGPYVLEPFRLFAELDDSLPYPHHSLLEAFAESTIHPHCFKTDPHWNRQGAEIAAKEIFRQALEAGYFSVEERPAPNS